MGNPQTLFECAVHTTGHPSTEEEETKSGAIERRDEILRGHIRQWHKLSSTAGKSFSTTENSKFDSIASAWVPTETKSLATVIHNENSEAMHSTADMFLFRYGVFCYTPLVEVPAAEC